MTELCMKLECWVRSRNVIDGCRLGLRGDEGFAGYLGDADVQSQLDGIVRNKAIYQKVAAAIAELGYNRTWQQCRV